MIDILLAFAGACVPAIVLGALVLGLNALRQAAGWYRATPKPMISGTFPANETSESVISASTPPRTWS